MNRIFFYFNIYLEHCTVNVINFIRIKIIVDHILDKKILKKIRKLYSVNCYKYEYNIKTV